VTTDLLFELRTPGGAVYTDIRASVYSAPDYAVELSTGAVPGRYYQFGVGDDTVADDRLKGFALRFDADGTGSQEIDYIDTNGDVGLKDDTTAPDYAFHWSLENGDVFVRRTWDTDAQQDACVPGAPNCLVYDERRIIPLAADGARIYWLEKRRTAFAGVQASTPATHLVRFYDREPLTGAATELSSGGSGVPQAVTRTLPRGAIAR
jgi:hypothetical protein